MKVKDAIDRMKQLEEMEENLSALQRYFSNQKTKEEIKDIEDKAGVKQPIDMLLINVKYEIKTMREKLRKRMYEVEF